MANTLEYNEIATIVNQVVSQATGRAVLTPTNTSEFITVAQLGLQTGYDNLMNSISQVLTRTIISTRPYTRKFKGLEADSMRWGNHVRKINYADRNFTDSKRLPLNEAVDQQIPVKDSVLQTNFYGQEDYDIPWTMFTNQLDVAFRSPDEFGAFITGKLQNISDQVEQKHESMARMVLANLIAGITVINNGPQVVHLLTEYNAITGLQLDATTVYQPDNFKPFMQWVYSRIAAVSSMLTERTTLYHQNVATKPIARHTPQAYQRIFLYAPSRFQVEKQVLADTYHDNYLTQAYTETVNFWQSAQNTDSIDVNSIYMDTDGTLKKSSGTTVNKVFGLIMDQEAAGYTVINMRNTAAPYNGKGEYQNFWMKFTDRYWNDFTENAVVLLLD